MSSAKQKFTADFETTTDENDCRVWATGICSIDDNLDFYCGNNIEFLFDFFREHPNTTYYFHNLKFDGEFILNYLFLNGWTHISDRTLLVKKSFSTLISDKGQFYSMVICFNRDNKITIYDSLKILPFSVDGVAEAFNLPISKLKIDYDEYRPVGHVLTPAEKAYLRNDVEIMSRALTVLFNQGLNKMTQGSNGLYDYKRIVSTKKFKNWFPIIECDYDIRQSYKGGFTYCDPRFKGKDVGEGIVLDVNSLYPWVMHDCMLPFGEPVFFDGQYEYDKAYPLYVQMFTCNFDLKDNHIPTLQLKNNLGFNPTEYVKSSNGEDITLCLTNVDLSLMHAHYNMYNIEYHSGWKFKASDCMFKEYVDKWMSIKIQSGKDKNKAMRALAKLMLNALYGKFGLNPHVRSKIPYYSDGMVKYTYGEDETRDPIYIPVATFVTAYARQKTISSAQAEYDRFMYADTDSLHLLGGEIPTELDVDDYKLGAWKIEGRFVSARYVRQKTYLEEMVTDKSFYLPDKKLYGNTDMQITCAGMPDRCYDNVSWDNFKVGSIFDGKLQMKHVPGGIVLKDIDFTIKS